MIVCLSFKSKPSEKKNTMEVQRLTDLDKKELDRYTRNFVMKTLQVIVQSRMGEKCKYTAKENSGLEWVCYYINFLSLILYFLKLF